MGELYAGAGWVDGGDANPFLEKEGEAMIREVKEWVCGIDFGTSNSSVYCSNGEEILPVIFPTTGTSTPSAVFFDNEENQIIFGHEAYERYVLGYPGRYLRALKKILGTPLADETTLALGHAWKFTEILTELMLHLKQAAERTVGAKINRAVVGRPVTFSDRADYDTKADLMLRHICRSASFKQVELEFEPIAAAKSYLHSKNVENSIVLVAELGGGTSDFCIVRYDGNDVNESSSVHGHAGVSFGGTDIDRALSLRRVMPSLGMGGRTRAGRALPTHVYFELATWHRINFLYDQQTRDSLKDMYVDALEKEPIVVLREIIADRRGHELASAVEAAKIATSLNDGGQIDLATDSGSLQVTVTMSDLSQSSKVGLGRRLKDCVESRLAASSLTGSEVDRLVLTGGTSQLPVVRDLLSESLPNAQADSFDVFDAVALGLALDAQRMI